MSTKSPSWELVRLSEGVYFLQGNPDAPAKATDPEAVLVFAWMNAQLSHATKYVALYHLLFPAAPIFLVLCTSTQFWHLRTAKRTAPLAPLLALLPPLAAHPRLHIHAMSNGGAYRLGDFLSLVPHALPLRNARLVLDSTPGMLSLHITSAAFLAGVRSPLMRALGRALLVPVYFFAVWLPPLLCARPNWLLRVRAALNDPAVIDVKSSRRAYVYSDGDQLVQSWAVEHHAEEARQKGYAVDAVKVVGSRHVEHLRREPEKYKQTVVKLWD